MAWAAAIFITAFSGCEQGLTSDGGAVPQADVKERVFARLPSANRSADGILSVEGSWKEVWDEDTGGYEAYVITAPTDGVFGKIAYTFSMDSSGSDDFGLSFTGDVIDIFYETGEDGVTHGVIIIQFITPPYDGISGWYSAVYFNELTEETVRFANAAEKRYVDPQWEFGTAERETEGEAFAEFIWENWEKFVQLPWNEILPQERQPANILAQQALQNRMR